jgi:hypothetical protein
MVTSRRLVKLSPALALIALVVPGSAFGQATRTWVSGVGDDANPCSRTAPCKTFAGAISKTAPKGEINVLDPGGFGGVTITKSITIKSYTEAGVLVSGTNAIVVNGTSSDKVTLKGLDFNGLGTGLTGLKVLSAASVHVLDSEVSGFKTGIAVVSSSTAHLVVFNTHVHDNGIGVFSGPGTAGATATVTTLRNDVIADNTCGIVTASSGASASTPDPAVSECGSSPGPGLNKTTVSEIFHTGIHDNGFGVYARGATALAEIAYNEITDNSTFGLRRLDSATIRTFGPPATNVIEQNTATDAPNSTFPLTKRQFKRAHGRTAHKRTAYKRSSR